MHQRYGKVLRFWMGSSDLMVSISDQDILSQIASTLHSRPKAAKKALGWLGHESPTFKSHEELRTIRSKVMPLLMGESLKYLCLVGQERTKRMLDGWKTATDAVEVASDFSEITFDIIGVALFGQEFSSTDLGQKFKKLFVHVLREAHPRSEEVIPSFWDPKYWQWRKSISRLQDCAEQLIKQRRQALNMNKRKDLLSLVLSEKDGSGNPFFSDEQARATIVTFVFAGFDTSASSLAWICYLLSQHPEVQARAQDEVDKVLAGRLPEFEDLDKLNYLTCVVKEAMRLYPPVPEALRALESDLEVGGYSIPKGATFVIPISMLHEDEQIWEEPRKFLPERFTQENGKDHPRYAYLPFGTGSKSCMGARFAMTEIRLVLAMMLQRFSLQLVPEQEVIPEMQSIILQPKYGLRLNVVTRNMNGTRGQTLEYSASAGVANA
ncbi:Putative cytochrome P450 120 [Halomicronema hongdechloris C2206]|uniref:Cytochrome P450 120 n=2 Tax=Halomicronema hongdechloris TaxID=1209493 RepID=A0A1Z3HJN0_9CYAN|nr:Putative cytochrome P450 120 [Halomicronema hongdechloris C2206]